RPSALRAGAPAPSTAIAEPGAVNEKISPGAVLDLLDWKRHILALYAEIRAANEPRAAWERWRAARDYLFASHDQSPLPRPDRAAFAGLPYFDYDGAARVLAEVRDVAPETYDIATSGEPGGSYRFTRFGLAAFELGGRPLELEVYW